MPPTPEPALPATWGRVLDRVLDSIGGVLDAADRRAAELDTALAQPEPGPDAGWSGRLDEVGRRLGEVDVGCRKVEERAAEVSALLDDGEGAVKLWLAQAAGAVQRLANCERPGV